MAQDPKPPKKDKSKNKYKCLYCGENYYKNKKRYAQDAMRGVRNCGKYECLAENAMKIYAKNKKKVEKAEAERIKVEIESTKTLTHYLDRLQTEINAIVRLIDYGYGCISCGSRKTPQAGHYHSRGSNATLRFHLHNIWVQCYRCNEKLSGNPIPYLRQLKLVYGLMWADVIAYHIIKENNEPLKLNRQELKEKIRLAQIIVKELEKNDKPYSEDDRWHVRTRINNRLGIYKPM